MPDEDSRVEITTVAERRFGQTGMGRQMVIGTPEEVGERLGRRHAEGVDRFYVWFADFAPESTLARFAQVISALG